MRSDMTTSAQPILYSFRRCPYAMRARLALSISGVPFALREVKLSAKPQAMLDASPKGTVPVLMLTDGKVIDESLEIMRWALIQHDPEGWLERDDEQLVETNDGAFKHALDRYKYPQRYDDDHLDHRASGLAFLEELDQRLRSAAQLCGAERGLTDAAIMPFVRQFAAVEPDWFATQALPHLKGWLAGHLASDLFQQIMTRFAVWSPDDAVAGIQGA
ncbi:glutathione S-transferase [Novosphingobium rosa]|uniref:glutathione S-transferase n=1 Tax=Novosphingobium rosa TaxID=76978 RepID=UPI000A93F452|nr:glutathione S-transferase [Novosphingobium rosa]